MDAVSFELRFAITVFLQLAVATLLVVKLARTRKRRMLVFVALLAAIAGEAVVYDALWAPNEGPIQSLLDERGTGLVAMRFVEPMQGNAAALGLNVMSIPAARLAVATSQHDDTPIASAAFQLTQPLPGADRTGVVVYRAIYASVDAGTPQQRPPLATPVSRMTSG